MSTEIRNCMAPERNPRAPKNLVILHHDLGHDLPFCSAVDKAGRRGFRTPSDESRNDHEFLIGRFSGRLLIGVQPTQLVRSRSRARSHGYAKAGSGLFGGFPTTPDLGASEK